MSNSDSRNQILNILLKVFDEDAFLQDVLHGPEVSGLSPEDRRFTEKVCRGVVEKYTALEEIINHVSKTPLKKMRPQIRSILLSAAYQILFLETEDYAACSEAVKLASKRGFSNLKGFVNGVLRTIVRNKEELLGNLSKEARSGLPEFLYEKYVSWFGEEGTETICQAMDALNYDFLTVRRIQLKNTPEEFEEALKRDQVAFRSVEGFSDIYEVETKGDPSRLQSYEEGRFYIQSFGSILATDIATDLFPSSNDGFAVLDACSSPGGKILNAYDKTGGKGQFTACDVNERKTRQIERNFEHFGVKNGRVLIKDATVFEPSWKERFDLVIADVPCSGLGTLSGKPDIRLHVTEESLEEIVTLQRKILSNVKEYVKPGGTLLFSTCTVNPSENEGNLEWLLAEDRNLLPVDFSSLLPENLRNETVGKGYLTILPGVNGNEGFFVSRLQKL